MQKSDFSEETRSALISNWRHHPTRIDRPILQAALDAIVEVGYHGTTIRKIAERSGLSVPGVYHYYPSKHSILVSIMEFAMEDLWDRTKLAIAEANGSAKQGLDRYVECMVLFHASRPALAATSLNEIRSLDSEARKNHIQRRDRQHRALDEVIDRGLEEQIFKTPYPRQASTAIITMCTSVAQWFSSDGELTPADLASRYQHFAQHIVRE